MDKRAARRGGWRWNTLYILYACAMVGLICLLFTLRAGAIGWLRYVGWALFVVSAALGWLPILAFRQHGRVAQGKSYMHTTALVTSGLYAVVRHPQYLASDFLATAVMCILQHWAAYLAGVVAVAANHITMATADRALVAKFGEPYREYMHRIPRWNLLVGLWRWLHHRTG